ncbi:MAG TPA: IPT/TIG domain-containing protein [Bryobacteraceae bacterium]|nr:IPT/TIG domain-containing protein [Bryobacteraceae bacterium]
MTRIAKAILFCCIASSWPLAAQAPTPDTSGNGMLNGTYYFRQVVNVISGSPDSSGIVGDISDTIAIYGTIAFDGNGNYVIGNGLAADAGVGAPIALSCYIADTNCASGSPVSGTYAISASGAGSISSPLGSVVSGDLINGLVGANGVFVGSATETTYGYGDLFIAAPLATPQPTNATFQGTYTVTGFFPGIGNSAASADAFFQLTADGNGNLGTVNVTGYYGGGGASTISQSSSNIKYFFSNGAAVVTFPTSTTANFFAGQEYLYFSPDGNFFFGGSPSTGATGTYGYDMIIGVRNGSGTQSLQGNYYQAGLDQNIAQAATSGYVDFDSYYGAFSTQSNGNILAHQRLNDLIFTGSSYDFTYSDSFPSPVTDTYTDNGVDSVYPTQYAVGANGAVRIGEGLGPFLGISVAVQAPTFTPTQQVYINPAGVVNAASFSPFTAGISNGEFITIFGTNLADSTATAANVPFPTTLGKVQVFINQVAAPIFFVSPGQVSVIAPAQNPYQLATIQVVNDMGSSNFVTMRVAPTTPGLYGNPSGGVYAAVYDYTAGQILTPSAPAQPGDVLEVYGTGFGVVSPPIPDGAAPPDSPLSYTYNAIAADVDGVTAAATPAFLAPELVGLYQINVTVPTTTTAGDHFLDISGTDPNTQAVESYSQQVLISVGSGALAETATPPAPMAHGAHAGTRQSKPEHQRPLPCFMGMKRACGVEK